MKFSVICPTLWLAEGFPEFVNFVSDNDLVDEIIIISNDRFKIPKNINFNRKIIIIDNYYNFGVNPSWNLGNKISKNENLIFMNDDIIFDINYFNYIASLITNEIGMIGLDNSGNFNLDLSFSEITSNIYGFGCLFFIHKNVYIEIPKKLKIFFGDNWLIYNTLLQNKKVLAIKNLLINGILSLSSRKFSDVIKEEHEIYNKEIKKL